MTDAAFKDTDPADQPRAPGSRASRPKDAATLILVRRDGGEPRVLMGRRSRGHAFMPNKWVFPGGRTDRADARAPSATELRPEVRARLEVRTPASKVRALGMAAIRETWEEAGLRLYRDTPAGPLPDLAALDFMARAITPPYHPKRFDARFFTADAADLSSLEREDGTGELDEIGWLTFPEARDADLPQITRFVLKELEQRQDQPDRPIPLVSFRAGARDLRFL